MQIIETKPDIVCTYEMAGPNLKYKHRVRKSTSGQGSKSSNSGKSPKGTPPKGMPKRYRGKTSYT